MKKLTLLILCIAVIVGACSTPPQNQKPVKLWYYLEKGNEQGLLPPAIEAMETYAKKNNITLEITRWEGTEKL